MDAEAPLLSRGSRWSAAARRAAHGAPLASPGTTFGSPTWHQRLEARLAAPSISCFALATRSLLRIFFSENAMHLQARVVGVDELCVAELMVSDDDAANPVHKLLVHR
jgi:hypothetical protein